MSWKTFFTALAIFLAVLPCSQGQAHDSTSLPKAMVGQWCLVADRKVGENEYERRDCRGTDGSMTLGKHHVFYVEDGYDFACFTFTANAVVRV
jgi:hypothetical protein